MRYTNSYQMKMFRLMIGMTLVSAVLAPSPEAAAAAFNDVEELRLERMVGRVLVEEQQMKEAAATAPPPPPTPAPNRWSKRALAQTTQKTVGFVADMVDNTLPSFLLFLAIFAFFALIAVATGPLMRTVLGRCIPNRFVRLLTNITQIFLVVVGLAIALAANDIDLWRILISFGIVGLILSSGVGAFVSNLIAGLMLPFDPEVDIGNEISVNGIRGRILSLDMLSTLIQRTDDEAPLGSVAYTMVPNHFFSDYPITIHYVSKEEATISARGNALTRRSGWVLKDD